MGSIPVSADLSRLPVFAGGAGGRFAVVLLLALLVLGGIFIVAERADRDAALHVLDVGQGDAILLRSGSADVLVDGGPDATVVERLGSLRPPWDRKIEVLVLTHPQQDHLAGFLPILERERVGMVLLPRVRSKSAMARAFVAGILDRGIPVRFAEIGQQIVVGTSARDSTAKDRLLLTVLAPGARALALGDKNPNHGGIVLRADVGRAFTALLTADLERASEHLLVRESGASLDVDVLKLAHHGSKTSTTERMLRATTPALALLSAGAGNRYGHPHPSVLARLRGLPLLRTDTHGTLSLVVRGRAVFVSCRPGCPGSLAQFAAVRYDAFDRVWQHPPPSLDAGSSN